MLGYMSRLRVLLLCHGERHTLGTCETHELPLSFEFLRRNTVRTVDVHARSHPTYVHDWDRPTRIRAGSVDVVSTMCCPSNVWVNEGAATEALNRVAFENVARVLRPGGLFIFRLAHAGVEALAGRLKLGSARGSEKVRDAVMRTAGKIALPEKLQLLSNKQATTALRAMMPYASPDLRDGCIVLRRL
jgi:SAM-dependent methyltransferase